MLHRLRWRSLAVAPVLCLLLAGAADARPRKHRIQAANAAPGDFAYYLLAMSWAPDFCALPNVQKPPLECGAGRRAGFVVHGLWPQAQSGSSPEKCAPARPVPQNIVNQMLPLMNAAGLIQHEWASHGTCSGLSVSQYFNAIQKAFGSVQIPADYKNLSQQIQVSPQDVESKFALGNPSFPKGAFRTNCTAGALEEVRVCFTKDLKAQACTVSAGECAAGNLIMRPLR